MTQPAFIGRYVLLITTPAIVLLVNFGKYRSRIVQRKSWPLGSQTTKTKDRVALPIFTELYSYLFNAAPNLADMPPTNLDGGA
jgi:hypothetical protein